MIPIIDVNKQSLFGELFGNSGLVLLTCLDFNQHNTIVLEKTLQKLLSLYGFAVKFYQLNTTNQPQLQQQLGNDNRPLFLLFHHGHIVDERNGFMTQDELDTFIDNYL